MFKLKEFNCGSSPPILLKFENGTLKHDPDDEFVYKTYQNESNDKILAVATDHMIYTEKILEEDYDNFLLIRKSNSKKILMIKTASSVLKPYIFKTPESENVRDSEGVDVNHSLNLNRSFGTKRSKIIIEQQEKMKLNIENIEDQLRETVADIEVQKEDMVVSNLENFEFRPPINCNASNIEDIYALDSLVASDVLNSLTLKAQEVIELEENELNLCDYIMKKIHYLKKSRPHDKIEKCKILLYVDCLIKCIKSDYHRLRKKSYNVCQYSEAVNKDILDKFTAISDKTRTRSKPLKDKAVSYAIVLTLNACNYQFSLENFPSEINVSIKSLQEMVRVLRLTSNGKLDYILKLPLPSAPSSNPRAKRRKNFD